MADTRLSAGVAVNLFIHLLTRLGEWGSHCANLVESGTFRASMTPDLWERLKPLYDAALEIPEEERAEFISNVCGEDLQVREELAALLKATDKSTAFSDSPIISLKGLFPKKADPFSVGALILGRFRIVRHLGTGGMGDV